MVYGIVGKYAYIDGTYDGSSTSRTSAYAAIILPKFVLNKTTVCVEFNLCMHGIHVSR